MSETTRPIGGSNNVKESIDKMFNFEVLQMDFQVDGRAKDEKESANSDANGANGDTTTPIIPGNYQTVDVQAFAKILANPGLIITKPTKYVSKDKKGKEDKEDEENEKMNLEEK